MTRILIIEDEPDMRRGLEDNLEYEGYDIVATGNGKEGLRLALKEPFDLILLDLMLPGMDGMDVCKEIKQSGQTTPIIMLTARGSEDDKIHGFNAGADDYITKPFSLKELLARIKAVLRRTIPASQEITRYTFGSIELDFEHYQATKDGQPIDLSPREFEILKLFILNEGHIVTRDDFLHKVWGYSSVPATRTVDNHIAKLRQKIEDDPDNSVHIITVHRMGYKFIP
ncbi:MAG: response regulator transcription factor [bacterium]|jgi:DNA-binding response OmpR family regulator|nr:response regulator transcription factor [bacterium]